MASVPRQDDANNYFRKFHPLWCGIPDRFIDHLVPVDMSTEWRQHVIHSKVSGRVLRRAITQRFSSSTIFLSVILAAEIGMITSPARLSAEVREALGASSYDQAWWTGIVLAFASLCSVGAITANYSAYAVFTAISDQNLQTIAKSSIGFYGAQLPTYLIIMVLYTFLATIGMFWFLVMPDIVATIMSTSAAAFLVYTISAYSALGSLVMSSGSMGQRQILRSMIEEEMTPQELSDELLRRKRKNMKRKLPIKEWYKLSSPLRENTSRATSGDPDPSESSGSEVGPQHSSFHFQVEDC